MFFDRNEIHIQAFVDFINGKLMSGDSSSSTFHDFQEFTISNYQNFRPSNLRIFIRVLKAAYKSSIAPRPLPPLTFEQVI